MKQVYAMGVEDPGGGTAYGSYYEPLGFSESSRKNGKKRRFRGEKMDMTESFVEEDVFMVIEGETPGKSLNMLNPFAVQKAIEAAITEKPKKATMLRDGRLLILVSNKRKASQLKNINLSQLGVKTKVYEHESLNTCKGVIRCDAICFTTESEIIEGLKENNVKEVHIIKRKNRDGEFVNSRTAILTFNSNVPPRKVNMGYYYDIKVEQYYPKPMRCMNCLRLGHTKKVCRGIKKCATCGDNYHEQCEQTARCLECGESHSTLDRQCPVYLDEVEIKIIQTKNRITMREAREIRRAQAPAVPRSYIKQSFAQMTRERNNNTDKQENDTQATDKTNNANTQTSAASSTDEPSKHNSTEKYTENTDNTTENRKQNYKKDDIANIEISSDEDLTGFHSDEIAKISPKLNENMQNTNNRAKQIITNEPVDNPKN